MEINLTIVGSRDFINYNFVKNNIIKIINENDYTINKIISGGARGVDSLGERFAKEFSIPTEIIKPDWKLGRAAAVIRNTEIINRSDVVIAFWDGESKGTKDSINKAKRKGKTLYIVNPNESTLTEGVRLGDDGNYVFDFSKDEKGDLLTLKFNTKGRYITSKSTNKIKSYFSYKTNKNVSSKERVPLLKHIKSELSKTNQYEHLLNKAVLGLFNNPYFDVAEVDLIIYPKSTSTLNFDVATKIKAKIPNALFLNDIIVKNDSSNIKIDYAKAKESGYSDDLLKQLDKMLENAIVDGEFQIKKIPPRFRRYFDNILKLDNQSSRLLNKIRNGKVLVVDDYINGGNTIAQINNLLENYLPEEIIIYTLIA